MKYFLLTILAINIGFNGFSQIISDLRAVEHTDKIKLIYSIDKAKYYQTFKVDAFVSFDGGKTFKGPLKAVKGEIGNNIKEGTHHVIWSPFEEYSSFDNELVFELRAKILELDRNRNYFICYTPGVLLNSTDYQPKFGIQFGQIGKIGWMISLKSTPIAKPNYTFDGQTLTPDQDISTYYGFTGQTQYQYLSITGGPTFQLKWNSFIYLTGGYFDKSLYWEVSEYDQVSSEELGKKWADIEKQGVHGFSLEAGIILKARFLTFSVGIMSSRFDYMGASLGVGVNF